MITQDELLTYKAHSDGYKEKKEKMLLISSKLEDLEDNLISRLEAGEEVEVGKRYPSIHESERRTVQWKSIVKQLKGQAFITQKLQEAVAAVTKKLVVTEV